MRGVWARFFRLHLVHAHRTWDARVHFVVDLCDQTHGSIKSNNPLRSAMHVREEWRRPLSHKLREIVCGDRSGRHSRDRRHRHLLYVLRRPTRRRGAQARVLSRLSPASRGLLRLEASGRLNRRERLVAAILLGRRGWRCRRRLARAQPRAIAHWRAWSRLLEAGAPWRLAAVVP